MKSVPQIFFATLISLLAMACSGNESTAEENTKSDKVSQSNDKQEKSSAKLNKLSADLYEKMRGAGVPMNVIDIRTPSAIADGKIPDALEMNYRDNDFEQKLDGLDKNHTFILYCEDGDQSTKTAEFMLKKGFRSIYLLEGGYKAWKEETSN